MDLHILKNIDVFMQRASSVGAEAYAWCMADQAVKAEITKLQTPAASTAPVEVPPA